MTAREVNFLFSYPFKYAGLDLSLSYDIIKAHGGEGSEFIIDLSLKG